MRIFTQLYVITSLSIMAWFIGYHQGQRHASVPSVASVPMSLEQFAQAQNDPDIKASLLTVAGFQKIGQSHALAVMLMELEKQVVHLMNQDPDDQNNQDDPKDNPAL